MRRLRPSSSNPIDRAAMAIRPTISQFSPNVSNLPPAPARRPFGMPGPVNPCRLDFALYGHPRGHASGHSRDASNPSIVSVHFRATIPPQFMVESVGFWTEAMRFHGSLNLSMVVRYREKLRHFVTRANPPEQSPEATRKRALLDQLRSQGISDERVLAALERVPRAFFLEDEQSEAAWENVALSIPCHQTISQPLVVALMTQALELDGIGARAGNRNRFRVPGGDPG